MKVTKRLRLIEVGDMHDDETGNDIPGMRFGDGTLTGWFLPVTADEACGMSMHLYQYVTVTIEGDEPVPPPADAAPTETA